MKNFNLYKFSALLIPLLAVFLTNCSLVEHDDQNQEENYGYETEAVANILNGTCATSGCHGGSSPTNGLSTERQSDIMHGTFTRPFDNNSYYGGDVVIPHNVEKSLIMQFVEGKITSATSYNHQILSTSQISTLAKWIGDGAKNYKSEISFENPESYRVYVCNSASENISTIDGTKKVVSQLTNLNNQSTFEDTPYWVAEYGDYLYVTLTNRNQLLKIRKSDNSIVASISNILSAGMVKINSAGSKAYVSRAYNSTSTYNSIYVINTNDMSLRSTITLPSSGLPHGLALDATRDFLYISDATNNIVHVVNTLNDLLMDTRFSLTNNYYPLFIEVSQDGNFLYVSARNTNELLVFNAISRLLYTKVSLLSTPMGISVSKNGSKIYVASNAGNAIEVVTKTNLFWDKTNTISHTTMSMPFAIDITSDDSYLYVTNQNFKGDFVPSYKIIDESNISTVTIINTATESIEKVIEVEENAAGIVVEKL
ncbi:MAG: YncE family protein [Melioribacteraceae bacterium]|jgi:DNA-binding beta-propeller fold protein YncE|nr:YncE family protein [Melioribacteraceae bacterium]